MYVAGSAAEINTSIIFAIQSVVAPTEAPPSIILLGDWKETLRNRPRVQITKEFMFMDGT